MESVETVVIESATQNEKYIAELDEFYIGTLAVLPEYRGKGSWYLHRNK